ncbi:hypothetical protein [Engelhardtia mirabilis]|uniref:PDZ domain-containing protein n=1 Tax=Engelhardtia mirabilis TaxID=2528011 RepID=A0A518BGB2_9BACT|nr:hypothetical protein Pla133_10290 [Planctomycetes bacterium Pla133]QDV00289.1 hypothetical protein Pla86_10280 [Planctomycetes bacterium Pla86]
MRSTASIAVVTLVLGLVVGVFVGRVVLGGGVSAANALVEESLAAGPAIAAGPRAGEQGTGAALAAPTSASGAVPVGSDLPPVDDVAARRAAERAIARVEVEASSAATQGDGAIWGNVRNDRGEPLAGVLMRLTPGSRLGMVQAADSTLGAAPARFSADTLEASARRQMQSDRDTRETLTLVDGSYRFEGLPDATWGLGGYLEGWGIEKLHRRVYSVVTGKPVDFVAVKRVPVSVRVLGTDGSEVSEALVSVVEGESSRPSNYELTGTASTLYLAPGEYEFVASRDVEQAFFNAGVVLAQERSPSVALRLLADQAEAEVELALAPASAIWGYATFAVPNNDMARVSLVEIGEDDDPQQAPQPDTSSPQFLEGGTGFGFVDVEPGRYVLIVSLGWNSDPAHREVIEYAGGLLRHDFVIDNESSTAERALRITALGPEGAPLRSLTFTVGYSSSSGRSSSSGIRSTYLAGIHSILIPERFATPGENAGDTHWVDVKSAGFGTQRVVVEPQVMDYSVSFGEPAYIVATVRGSNERPAATKLAIQTTAVNEQSNNRSSFGDSIDVGRDGSARIGPLTAGLYRVELQAVDGSGPFGGGRLTLLDSLEIELGAGDNALSLVAPAIHRLTVNAPDLGSEGHFALVADEGAGARPNYGWAQIEDGSATFESVVAGSYQLLLNGRRERFMDITVPPTEVTFVGSTAVAMEVQISDPGARLGLLGLRSGDRIVSIDGKSAAEDDWQGLVEGCLRVTSGEYTLGVERSGSRIELTFDASEVEETSLGGNLVPRAQ